MAISRDQIGEIARAAAEKVVPTECKRRCISAGMTMNEIVGKDIRYAPTAFPINVAGLVKEVDLVVPHSELAMHVGAAGKKLLAWAIRYDGRYAHIIFDDGDNCCGYTSGLPSEVLSPEVIRVTKDIFHIKEG